MRMLGSPAVTGSPSCPSSQHEASGRADALASVRPACGPASKTRAPPRLPGPASMSAKRAGALGSEGDSLRRRQRGAGARAALASARPACWPASKTRAPPCLPGPASMSAKRAGALGSEGDSLRRRRHGTDSLLAVFGSGSDYKSVAMRSPIFINN
jgi:hypothetical protein